GRPWGRAITNRLLCRHPLSRLYGAIQGSGLSRGNIAPFIAQYGIDLNEAIVPPNGFASFNDFFIRRLTPTARPVDSDPRALIAPADSRLQVFTIENNLRLTIKGASMTLPQLLGRSAVEGVFEGGLCLIFRLAPSDYHRFAYVEEGRQGPVHAIDGPLHSVSPLSLRHKPDVHATNYRHWCLVQSPRLGALVQIEVGAMMVGSIVQNQPRGGPCRRGQEKGYFQFGGSTVIVILQPGRAVMDADIAEHSSQGIETLVRYGERVGTLTR
ncbi:MAG: phosphatidylserine decarboxylase, partial [Desulfobacterales bacterium]|nr:phosphatidylserine decarboxylase [Desulfobacterales bacterium]